MTHLLERLKSKEATMSVVGLGYGQLKSLKARVEMGVLVRQNPKTSRQGSVVDRGDIHLEAKPVGKHDEVPRNKPIARPWEHRTKHVGLRLQNRLGGRSKLGNEGED